MTYYRKLLAQAVQNRDQSDDDDTRANHDMKARQFETWANFSRSRMLDDLAA